QPYDETNVTMTQGEYFNTTEMQVDDDIYAGYNYTGVGEYRATYSFTDELGETGTDIDWITFIDSTDGGYSAEVIASEDGHKNVIKFLTDGDNGAYTGWYQDHPDQTADGTTVEFWFKYIDYGQGGFTFYFTGLSSLVNFIGFDSVANIFLWYYGDGGGGTTSSSTPAPADMWHHVTMIYDFTADTYDIYLNGILRGDDKPYYNDNLDTGISNYRLQNDGFGGVNSAESYFDAAGHSWDNDYMVGWNREEYAFFGDYNSTYSFEGDLIGSNPAGWTVYEGGGTVNVIGSVGNHKKVVGIDDTDAVNIVNMYNIFTDGVQTSGTVELWVRTTDKSKDFGFRLQSSGTVAVQLVLGYNLILYYDLAGNPQNLIVPNNDQWYHIRIDFECGAGGYEGLAADRFHIYIDGVKYSDLEFRNVVTNVDRLHFSTITVHSNYIGYVDAIDYSW
ncbi:hypothetical protein LCGC14_2666400, partial [marine sediment metagenome]